MIIGLGCDAKISVGAVVDRQRVADVARLLHAVNQGYRWVFAADARFYEETAVSSRAEWRVRVRVTNAAGMSADSNLYTFSVNEPPPK